MSLFNNPNSSHIFNDSEISDDDGDLNILRLSRRTYSKVNYDSGSEKSFRKSTTNTKNIVSSSLCENDLFFDEKSKKNHENKIRNKDRLFSLFDYEEDKCSASECDFSEELLSPIFPDKTYQRTGNNMKRKVIEKELNLDEPKSKHSNSNMLLKSVQTFNQQSSASLSMSSKVKSNDTEGNIQKSPLHEANGKCTVAKEIKTKVSSYNKQFTQDSINGMSMLEFVQLFSAERNQEHINRRKSELKKKTEGSDTSNAKKLTHGPESTIQKIVPKSTGTEKGNNTVIKKSTSTQKLNHGNFEQIKRPDIDKHSMQKPLQIIDDESNSGSSVLDSSPLLPFIPQLTDINDSTVCVQVSQSNTISTSDAEGSDSGLHDLESDYADNYVVEINILTRNLTQDATVNDFCSHPDASRGSDTSKAKKLTHGLESSIQKIVPKSTGTEKGNNTVIKKSTSTQKLNHGNFEQIKRPDIDKHSMQKPLQIIDDESNSGSSVLDSSPLLPFIPQLTDINDSSVCVQFSQSNTISTSDAEGSDSRLHDLESDYADNYVVEIYISTHNLTQDATVNDFCSHPDASRGSDTSKAKKLTLGPESSIQKIVPKSTGTEKGNNTVIEKSTSTQKLNHGNFEQIKRPDIDKHSLQKPLQIIDDESNSGSSILHSSPLLKEGSDSGSHDLDYVHNYVVAIDILRRYLTQHSTVNDFCSHPDARIVLSKLSYETDDLSPLHRINHDNDPFQEFLNCSVLSLIQEYVWETILNIFPEVETQDLQSISTYRVVKYAYEGHNNDNEIFYFSKIFRGNEFLNLDAVVCKLGTVALLMIYDNFVKGYRD